MSADGLPTILITLAVRLDLPDVRVLFHGILEVEVEAPCRLLDATAVVEKLTGLTD